MSFSSALNRVRRWHRAGRWLAALLAVLALACWLGVLGGLADAWRAFDPAARTALVVSLLVILAVAALAAFIAASRVSAGMAAHVADRLLGSPRSPASTALGLSPESADSPLAKHLVERTLAESATALDSLPAKRLIPWRMLRTTGIALACALATIGAIHLTRSEALRVIASRLLHPGADIPPFSKLVFNIEPSTPTAVYGGDLTLSLTLTGDTPRHAVECLVRSRRSGEVLRLPAFRESPSRFSRKLDGLTEPIDIAFACGKARSRWLPVEILLEPDILSGIVTLTPPAHTGLPASEFSLDTNEIAAVEGTVVTLELTSNRPLGSGSLVFTPAVAPGTPSSPEILPGHIGEPKSAVFTWTASRPGQISATLRDLRGTPSPRPLDLAFRLIPDQPPAVDLISPPPMMLATPRSIVPVSGNARDDFALARLQFVRTLSGFRDRVRVVAPALREKEHAFEEKLDLEELGLEPGQTIELMLEATDHNPSLLGHGSSGISRIRIISEDDYAEYIRTKTTVDQFRARFQAAREAIQEARESLENLRDALEEDLPGGAAEAIDKAREAHEEAAGLLEKIERDFPAFELENRLRDLAAEQTDTLRENLRELEDLPPGGEDSRDAVEDMLDRLGRHQQQADELEADVALVDEMNRLLEMAAEFRRIYLAQESLSKRFESIVRELQRGDRQNLRMLPALAETQERNREALDTFARELRKRAEAAAEKHPELGFFAAPALEFLEKLEEADPGSLMDTAAANARDGQAREAFTNAELARVLLERLMSDPENAFAEAIQGNAPRFDIARPDVNENIEQMLKALLAGRAGGAGGAMPGQGGAAGAGAGQGGESGTSADGHSMELPVLGPDRLQFDSLADGSKGGDGGGQGGNAVLPDTAETGRLAPEATREGEAPALSPESIPEPYREAVKRYFTP